MERRIVVFSHPLLTPPIQQVMAMSGVDFPIVDDVLMEAAAEKAQQMVRSGLVDVLISAGANAALLRKSVGIPVVEFSVTALGLPNAIAAAAECGGPVPMFTYEQPLAELMGIRN